MPSSLSSLTKSLLKRPSTTGTLHEPPKIIASFGLATD
nr:MAG TPA: hypothetical protein [Caudoviricetes sp.]